MTKQITPFLMVDYELLEITTVEVNGEKKEVKLHHKILYSYLKSLSGTFKQVTPSLTGIGKRLGIGTDQTVRRHIQDLMSFGWVQVVSEGREGKTNIYIVLPYHQKPPVTVFDVVPGQPVPEPATAEETQDDAPNWGELAPPDNAIEKSEPLGLPEMITDEMKIDAVCDLLSKTQSLRQQSRGDTFINYARRVLHRKSMKLPSRFEEELEMRFEHRYPHFYGRFGTPF
ncbi:helix-turn-helix domain-containing protein [Escherichia coli]|uniref:helix-turn-helix domain-containing protein n=1 Tax=Escherichia coli TaxID=562 RepID=UPI001FF2B14B|nr:helix-turn-helix domain-containing protein [Escherichia coli]